MKVKLPRKKRCKACGEWFQPERQLQPCCSIPCAIGLMRKNNRQDTKSAHRDAVKKFADNDPKLQKALAQKAFNAFTRERDKDLPCISCGRHHQGQYHAGHYRSVGAAPALRFNEDNCHKQCAPCNNHKSGNILEYRINLIKKIGAERVAILEADQLPRQYKVDDYIEIKTTYLRKIREIKRSE
jgi:hypothetical protein